MYNWNHRSGCCRLGQVLDRGRSHRRQRVRQPVPLRRPRRGDLAPGVHHPRVPGGRQRQRERQIPVQQPRGGVHRGDLGQRARLEPPAPERSQVALHRQLLIGAAVDVVEHRPRNQPAPHGTQVVDVVARPQSPPGRVELDWLHPDQLTNFRCPHVRDDNPARPSRARAAPLSTRPRTARIHHPALFRSTRPPPAGLPHPAAYSLKILMIVKDLVLLAVPDPSRSWKSSELIARPAQQPGAGDADVTGVSIAPRVTVACRWPGAVAAISVVDPGSEVDPGDWDTPNQPHNPDPPR